MKLRCKTRQHLVKLYHQDFLGQQGFLLPGDHVFVPGRPVDLQIMIGDEFAGTAKTLMIWQNLAVQHSELLPRGTFYKVLHSDTRLANLLVLPSKTSLFQS